MCQICVTRIWAWDYKQRLPDLSTNSAANSSKHEHEICSDIHLKVAGNILHAQIGQTRASMRHRLKRFFKFCTFVAPTHDKNAPKQLGMWACVFLQWRGACTPCRRALRCPKWKERRTASSGSFTWTSTSPASGGDPRRNRTRPKVSYQHKCFAQLYQDKKDCVTGITSVYTLDLLNSVVQL